MHSFTDAFDREWKLRITIGAAERLKQSELKADLLALEQGEPPLNARLATDHAFRFHCLFVLLEPQADLAEVDDQAFCEGMDAKAVAAATTAFWEELTDFFRSLDRPDLLKLIEAQRQVIEANHRHNIGQVERNLEQAIRLATTPTRMPPEISGSTSGDAPESSDSTPALSLSGSSTGL